MSTTLGTFGNGMGVLSPEVYEAANNISNGGTATPYNQAISQAANDVAGSGGSTGVYGASYDPYAAANAAAAQQAAQAAAAYNTQNNNLNDLLGRTQTGLDQGLSQLNDSYTSNKTAQQNQEDQALQDYTDKRTATTKDRGVAYDTAAKNANNGYRSLSQLIGRASGTGSSAYQDLLPNVVGKDLSAKRSDANLTYASNLGNIDTAQKKTEQSFAQILQDLANQRQAQENSLRTGVEGQRQSLLGQQQQLQAAQGNLGAVNDLQGQIEGSRNSVESFFNQFKPTLTAQQAAIAAPDISKYTVDRSNVNAANAAPGQDNTNPYAQILKKQLQEQAV